AKAVWDILMNFEDYPRWNPFIKKISGDLQLGSQIEVSIQPPNSNMMTFKPKILEYEPLKKLRWIGKTFIPKIFDGEHSLIIQEITGDKVLFIQKEQFTGIFVPIVSGLLNHTNQGFELMNQALKVEAEKN
ncbi:MAG TPA: SRPBCC domain-containing protein, partial [Methanobacterium sp.]|nr:SRPBCC domain-containing protein [Methanobacterium sp.]